MKEICILMMLSLVLFAGCCNLTPQSTETEVGTGTHCDGLGDCYDNVVSSAIASRNETICSEMDYNVENCVFDVAVGIPDSRICEKLSDEDYRGNCYIAIAGKRSDDSYCSRFTGTRLEDCIGVASTSKESCDRITTLITRAQCYANVIDKGGDYRICYELSRCETEGASPGHCLDLAATCCMYIDNEYARGSCEGGLQQTQ